MRAGRCDSFADCDLRQKFRIKRVWRKRQNRVGFFIIVLRARSASIRHENCDSSTQILPQGHKYILLHQCHSAGHFLRYSGQDPYLITSQYGGY